MRFPLTPLVVASLAALLSLVSGTVAAQPLPPDVVRTKDGGMLRGTIIEKVPNDHVEIQLPNGQSRTLKMSDVSYAGPVSADTPAPTATPPAPAGTPPAISPSEHPVAQTTIQTGMARLALKADQNSLTFHRKVGTSQGVGTGWVGGIGKNQGGMAAMNVQLENFERLCTAPCSVDIREGTYRLGLSLDDGAVVPAEPPVNVRGSLQIQGRVESYTGVRAGGVLIVIAGGIAGIVVTLQGKQNCDTGVAGFCTTPVPGSRDGHRRGQLGRRAHHGPQERRGVRSAVVSGAATGPLTSLVRAPVCSGAERTPSARPDAGDRSWLR